jgi:hypothetical protein
MKIACMLSWLFFSAQTIIGIYTLAGGDEFVKNAVIAIPFGISQARWKMPDRSLWCMFSV